MALLSIGTRRLLISMMQGMTMMIYTHVLNRGGMAVGSPLDEEDPVISEHELLRCSDRSEFPIDVDRP
jgi:hypothetical protein